MKKLLLASTLALGLFNAPTQASLVEKESKDEVSHITSVALPEDVLRHMVRQTPEILPAAVLVCKNWHAALESHAKATTLFFKALNTFSQFYNTDFIKSYFAGNNFNEMNRNAIRQMFGFVVFKKKGVSLEKPTSDKLDDHALATYEKIRHLFTHSNSFPEALQTAFPGKFGPLQPSETIRFNYLTLFDLYRIRTEVTSESLSCSHTFFVNLSTLLTAPDQKARDAVIKSVPTLRSQLMNSDRFYPLGKTLFQLFKLALVKTGHEQVFLKKPTSYTDLEEFQSIPVNFETLDQDIEDLKTLAETLLLALATKRWETLEAIKNMLRVG